MFSGETWEQQLRDESLHLHFRAARKLGSQFYKSLGLHSANKLKELPHRAPESQDKNKN